MTPRNGPLCRKMIWVREIRLIAFAAIISAALILGSEEEPQLRPKLVARGNNNWKPTGDRHHIWRLPKTAECVDASIPKLDYDFDKLQAMARGAVQLSSPKNPRKCDRNVKCFQPKDQDLSLLPPAALTVHRNHEYKCEEEPRSRVQRN